MHRYVFKMLIAWLLVFVWMGVIFYFSDMNSDTSNSKSKTTINEVIEKTVAATNEVGITDKHPTDKKKELVTEFLNRPLRKVAHGSVYFILAILLIYAFLVSIQSRHKKLLLVFLVTILICFLYACSDEYHQTFVVGRTGQFSDVLIDSVGALLGSGLSSVIYVFFRKKRRKKKKCIN